MEAMEAETTVEKRLLYSAARNRQPVNGSLELLPLCNMDCDMCYVRLSREEMERNGKLRSAAEWLWLARQMEQEGVLFLLLTGGEPLLFPEFRRLYLELKQLGMILTINTNGTLLDVDWAEFFGRHKPRRMNITLYGADEKAYRTLCHYPGGFEKAVQAVRMLRAQGVDVKINSSVTAQNRNEMQKLYELAKELSVPIHMDTYMVPCTRERERAFARHSRLDPEEAAAAGLQALRTELDPEAYKMCIRRTLEAAKEGGTEDDGHLSCMAGNCSFTVNWQGQMRPCVILPEPSVPVFESGFADAWKQITEKTAGIRIHSTCRRCRLRPLCSTCAAGAFWETGKYDRIPEYNCRYAKELLRLMKREAGTQSQPPA